MSVLPITRIYRYRENHKMDFRNYTYVANLTEGPIYVSYFGRRGLTLPGITEDSTPILCMLRRAKSNWKQKKINYQFAKDLNNESIAVGTYDKVEEAIATAWNKLHPVVNEEENNNEGT